MYSRMDLEFVQEKQRLNIVKSDTGNPVCLFINQPLCVYM